LGSSVADGIGMRERPRTALVERRYYGRRRPIKGTNKPQLFPHFAHRRRNRDAYTGRSVPCRVRRCRMHRPPLIAITIAMFVAGLAQAAPAQAGDAAAAARRFLQHETRHLADEVDVQVRATDTPARACRDPEPFLPGNASRLLGR